MATQHKRGPFDEVDTWLPKDYPWLLEPSPRELPVPLGPRAHTAAELEATVPEGVYTDKAGDPVDVGRAVVEHLLAKPERWNGREQYFPLIPHVIENPQEMWVTFIRYRWSGRFALRRKYFGLYEIEGGPPRAFGVVVDTIDGRLVAFSAFDGKIGGRLRTGRLAWPNRNDPSPPRRSSHSGSVGGGPDPVGMP